MPLTLYPSTWSGSWALCRVNMIIKKNLTFYLRIHAPLGHWWSWFSTDSFFFIMCEFPWLLGKNSGIVFLLLSPQFWILSSSSLRLDASQSYSDKSTLFGPCWGKIDELMSFPKALVWECRQQVRLEFEIGFQISSFASKIIILTSHSLMI